MGKPDPPPAPDYQGAANAQGAANIEAARLSGKLNNPNVYSPYGTQTVKFGEFNEAAYDAAMADYEARQQSGESQKGSAPPELDSPGFIGTRPRSAAPDRRDYTTDADQPSVYQTLSPDQQQVLDSSNDTKISLSKLASQGARAASGVLGTPFNYGGISQRGPTNITGSADPMRSADFASAAGMPVAGSADLLTGAPGMRSTDFSGGAGVPAIGAINLRANAPGMLSTDFTTGAPSMPGSADALRNQVYNASMSRVNEDTGLARDQKHSTLIASGIPEGSKAYSDAMIGIDRGYNDARQQAILGAGAEAQRQFGMDLQARQQGVGERAQMFGAGTQAQQQAIQEQMQQQQADIAARQQGFTEQERMFGAGTTAQQQAVNERLQQFTAGQASRQQAMTEQEKMFGASTAQRQQQINEALQQYGLSGEERRQQIAEALALRQTPLNEINALQSGSQVSNPFAMPGYAQNAQIQAAPLYQATADLAGYNTDVYNTKAASNSAMTSGLMGLGGAAIGGAAIF